MDESNSVVCPFCKDTDFDLVGLKWHLESGMCDEFYSTPYPFDDADKEARAKQDRLEP